ncbi:MAG: Gfo/Idh/MocA family oxidoreductase [Faecalibacterium sp.]|nr:Gfo/Idh/MocA family oxidoreductase [Faecalibacterium sp.]
MKTNLTALFIGLGSIGTRHLNSITALCAERGIGLTVHALRSDLARPLRDGVAEKLAAQFTALTDPAALPHYDLVYITNPTSLHAEVLQQIKGLGDTLFIEKPIFSAEQTGLDLAELLPPGQKAYVAAPMRWSAVMLHLKQWLADHPDQRPYSARVITSSYLPDWRPGVDYRTVYSAHRALGGGVTIDLIHEWDYLVGLFGKPLQLYNFKGTYSDLEIDSDDLSVYIARWPAMLAEVHLDYFGRKSQRYIELYTREGMVKGDFLAATLTLPDGTVQQFSETTAAWYRREMEYFLDYALTGVGESVNSPAEALAVLKLTLGEA